MGKVGGHSGGIENKFPQFRGFDINLRKFVFDELSQSKSKFSSYFPLFSLEAIQYVIAHKLNLKHK